MLVRTFVLLLAVGGLFGSFLLGEWSLLPVAAALLDTVMGEEADKGALLAMSSSLGSLVDELDCDSLLGVVFDLCGILKLLALKLAMPEPRPKANAMADGGVPDFMLVNLLSSVSPVARCLSFLAPGSALLTGAASELFVSDEEGSSPGDGVVSWCDDHEDMELMEDSEGDGVRC